MSVLQVATSKVVPNGLSWLEYFAKTTPPTATITTPAAATIHGQRLRCLISISSPRRRDGVVCHESSFQRVSALTARSPTNCTIWMVMISETTVAIMMLWSNLL